MVHSNHTIDLLVAVVLIFLTIPIARKVAAAERDPGLYRLLMWAMVTHLVFVLAALYVINHVYHGVTDYTRYVNQGAIIGRHFDRFDFTLQPTVANHLLGDGSVSVAAGVVFAIVGVNKIAGFFVFSWFAFLASICFYRAFSITFPEASRRRYAYLVFFLPSLLFWTAGISKEAMMFISLGISAYGAARILAQRRGGVGLIVIGTIIGVYVRPQELLLFLGAFAIAGVFRRANKRSLRGIRRILVMALQAALLIAAVTLAQQLGKTAPVFNLQQLSQNNRGQASSIAYHAGPSGYPRDINTVLFDPLPFDAHGSTQKFAAFENTIILILILLSLPRLRLLIRAAFLRPYVLMAVLYSAAWPYAFAALGNLGLIDRERIMLLPFLVVPLAIPRAPKGTDKYPWELSSAQRRNRKKKKTTARWSATVGAGTNGAGTVGARR